MSKLVPIECEARIVGLSKQRRKDGDWIEVKFHIHPDDHPAALFILPLGTHCMLSVKGTPEETGSEQRSEPAKPERPKGGPLSQEAGRLCANDAFQIWYLASVLYDDRTPDQRSARCAEELRRECGVSSRAQLDHDAMAAKTFRGIVAAFREDHDGTTTDQLQTARDAGYR